MRRILLLLLPALLATLPAAAQAPGARRLAQFQNWTAATYQDGGQKVCYAFARASKADGVANRPAAQVLLTVTHRPQGRDQVALRAGYTYPRNAEVKLQVGTQEFVFYTNGADAYGREDAALVRAFRGGREVLARGPGPGGRGTAQDLFPLAGFAQAYDAISKECPPPPAGRR